jgi:hypothetical protein
MPDKPQLADGWRIEPPVSPPTENATNPALVAAAGPLEEPPLK